jgi:hypothetical protein
MNPLAGRIDASIHAAELRNLDNFGEVIGHQLAMGKHGTRIYITGEMARQWIAELSKIATEESN